ncbi:hypothetical protein QJS10_CPA02g00016 [Acorus calamus]|uniref:Tubulin alpha-6 chain n=1 Tax=Acorus calamus TaxID=4465 RepID=A0AAV9FG41_ACOCL|nr:hypothetical protein QJS10_CPA02g00016 [Acorus calamus]
MACLQIGRSGLTPILGIRSGQRTRFTPGSVLVRSRKRHGSNLAVRCQLKEGGGEGQSNGDEPPESLFMKELKRRGMTPTSLLEETTERGRESETDLEEDVRGSRKRNGVGVSEDVEKGLANQRERSMALNSEGLEGLIPRAKLLLTLGGTFFLGFWPLILITVTVSLTLYFYFGPSFVHDASKSSISPPPYIDPYTLLEDDRLSQSAPLVK